MSYRKITEHHFDSPDVFVLPYVEAVKVMKVGFILCFALRLGKPLYHLRFELHGNVAWQYGQEELLLLPWTEKGQWVVSYEALYTRLLDVSYGGGNLLTNTVEEVGGHQSPFEVMPSLLSGSCFIYLFTCCEWCPFEIVYSIAAGLQTSE